MVTFVNILLTTFAVAYVYLLKYLLNRKTYLVSTYHMCICMYVYVVICVHFDAFVSFQIAVEMIFARAQLMRSFRGNN